MALIAAHLHAGVILVMTAVRNSLPSPRLLGCRGHESCRYLFGNNSAINQFNQTRLIADVALTFRFTLSLAGKDTINVNVPQ